MRKISNNSSPPACEMSPDASADATILYGETMVFTWKVPSEPAWTGP